MTPARLHYCLLVLRWPPETMAIALGCDLSLIEAWLDDEAEIPPKTAAWIEALATVHEQTEKMKPTEPEGKRFLA